MQKNAQSVIIFAHLCIYRAADICHKKPKKPIRKGGGGAWIQGVLKYAKKCTEHTNIGTFAHLLSSRYLSQKAEKADPQEGGGLGCRAD